MMDEKTVTIPQATMDRVIAQLKLSLIMIKAFNPSNSQLTVVRINALIKELTNGK